MQTGISLARKEKKMGALKAYIIHGWTYSTEKYNKLSQLLKLNGLGNVVLRVPGLTEKLEDSWELKDYVNWIKKIVSREKGKTILIGHSNGGKIAAAFAVTYPQKLSHLILIDSAGIYHDEFHVKIRLLFFQLLAKLGKNFSSSAVLKNLMYKMTGESDYNNATPLMKKTMTNLIKIDLSLSLNKIVTPTLIIWGENDKVTPLNDAKIIHRLIKNSKLHIIKGAKHSPHFTHAEEVSDIILKYLKAQSAKVKATA